MKAGLLACLLGALSGAASAKSNYVPPIPAGSQSSFVTDPSPLSPKYLYSGMAFVPETSFLISQSKGGSILLGPLLGGMRVKAKSAALGKEAAKGFLDVDLPGIAATSLAAVGLDAPAKDGAYTVKPFGFVQQCAEDQTYRVALAYDVKAPGKKAWHGRYVAHLSNAIPYAHFHEPTAEHIAAFTADLTAAADAATKLLQRDMRGEIAASGREVKLGSLNYICSPMGAMGMYTSAKDFAIGKVSLIEERDGNLVLRLGHEANSMLFGVHTMARSQVHKLD
jgi:hypothetical protein